MPVILISMTKLFNRTLLIISLYLVGACGDQAGSKESHPAETQPLFTLLPPDSTNIHFNNMLEEGLNTNVLMYEYFYNGGGVAVGDVNGDGIDDVYFSSNMGANKLYLNKGKMQFDDITEVAGVAGRPGPWKTGVTLADVNADGLLDIYLCYSGRLPGAMRTNQLFINRGNNKAGVPNFSEAAREYGLADSAYSTQAVFFDYDRDSDVDMFLLNHSPVSLPVLDEPTTAALLQKENPMYGVRLYRNSNGKFTDVTKASGLSSSSLTYGLGAGVADINGDGWPDIYISNDYTIPDFLYINNHDGTFTDRLAASFGHISQFSMGNDIADVNNDGLPDIFSLDMLPEDNRRQKLLVAPDNYEKFDLTLRTGFHYQYMRNMLQLNNGNGTFSEIGQLAGLSNTDWSWAPLFADYDNDGWKDLYVTNGILRDFTNMDFVKFTGDYLQNNKGGVRRQNLLELVHKMPSSEVTNYMFRNNGDLTFTNMSQQWGFAQASASTGAAYADLDKDGDLDLVVNNTNQPAFIYRNEQNGKSDNHYLSIKLQGEKGNTQGLGAKVSVFSGGRLQYQEQMPTRGFQSSVSPITHFGIGKEIKIDSLEIVWNSGRRQKLFAVDADRLLILQEKEAAEANARPAKKTTLFEETSPPLPFSAAAGNVNDFKRQPLLINPLSFSGPVLVTADFDKDGLEDIYAGGGNGQAGTLYLQQQQGRFVSMPQPAFEADKDCHDTDARFFDANADGFTDLYVCSGGYHNYLQDDPLLQDRLYLNDGKGKLRKQPSSLPSMPGAASCVRVSDINGDGHPDLFVGRRSLPGRYPEPGRSYLLLNDGKGNFVDRTASLAPALSDIGMITDAAWTDINADGKDDLVIVGEWMPVTIMINVNGRFENKTTSFFDKPYSGWWNSLYVGDLDKDGRNDLVIGNLGENTQCRASDREPAELYFKDFDDNGAIDPILCFYIQGRSYPYVTRDELLDQLSMMRGRFADYKSYADAGISDIFTEEELAGAKRLTANHLKTTFFQRSAAGNFREIELPVEAQVSPVFTITPLDYDTDGHQDLLLCGNINRARLRFGKYDANYGVLLKGDGKGGFTYIPQAQSGFRLSGDVRSVVNLRGTLIFGINGKPAAAYRKR